MFFFSVTTMESDCTITDISDDEIEEGEISSSSENENNRYSHKVSISLYFYYSYVLQLIIPAHLVMIICIFIV